MNLFIALHYFNSEKCQIESWDFTLKKKGKND